MSAEPTLEAALERVVLAARRRAHDLEVQWCDDRGRWDSPQFQALHEELTACIAAVEAARPHAALAALQSAARSLVSALDPTAMDNELAEVRAGDLKALAAALSKSEGATTGGEKGS